VPLSPPCSRRRPASVHRAGRLENLAGSAAGKGAVFSRSRFPWPRTHRAPPSDKQRKTWCVRSAGLETPRCASRTRRMGYDGQGGKHLLRAMRTISMPPGAPHRRIRAPSTNNSRGFSPRSPPSLARARRRARSSTTHPVLRIPTPGGHPAPYSLAPFINRTLERNGAAMPEETHGKPGDTVGVLTIEFFVSVKRQIDCETRWAPRSPQFRPIGPSTGASPVSSRTTLRAILRSAASAVLAPLGHNRDDQFLGKMPQMARLLAIEGPGFS